MADHTHAADHTHGRSSGPTTARRDLAIAAGANSVLLVVQVIGAVAFGSLALLADSVHQASDVVSLVLAVGIASLVARPSSLRYTFGLGRADALGGLAHAALLAGGAVLVVVEAIRRFDGDHHVDGFGVVVLATVGLLINGLSARWLHAGHGHSLNVEGAVLHLVSDALGSLVVLLGGVAVMFSDADWVDPAASLVVAALIVWSALRLTRSSLHILLDGVPAGIDIDEIRRLMIDDPLVTDAHHIHVRALDGDTLSLTGHVRIETDQLHDAQVVTRRLTAALADQGIGHVTLQAECHPCEGPDC